MRKAVHWIGGISVAVALAIAGIQNPQAGCWLLYIGVWLWILSHLRTLAILNRLLAYGRSGSALYSFLAFAGVGIGGGLLLSTTAWTINRYLFALQNESQSAAPSVSSAQRFRITAGPRMRRGAIENRLPFLLETGKEVATLPDMLVNLQITNLLDIPVVIESFTVEMETADAWIKLRRLVPSNQRRIFALPTSKSKPHQLDVSSAHKIYVPDLFKQLKTPIQPHSPISGCIVYVFDSNVFDTMRQRLRVTIREVTGVETIEMAVLMSELKGDPIESFSILMLAHGKTDLSQWRIVENQFTQP